MARVNRKENIQKHTHEGAPARNITPEQELQRSVLSCLLWENEFYEDGVSIADRIANLSAKVKPAAAAKLAIDARSKYHLRHVPLWIVRQLAKTATGTSLVSNTLNSVIQRPDEISEFVAMYWKDGKQPLSSQVKKGLAKAFDKFDSHQLAKYKGNANSSVTLRDVMFMVRPKPHKNREETFRALANKDLVSTGTWEANLSAGQEKKTEEDKKKTWSLMLAENKMPSMALLRNLRNMTQAGVDRKLVSAALENANYNRVLPFRFIAALNHAPEYASSLNIGFLKSVENLPKLPGRTIVLVDVSQSMFWEHSVRSEMKRADAAAALATIVRGDDVRVFTFSDDVVEVPAFQGLSGVSNILNSQYHGGTYLGNAVREVGRNPHDRLIVITDEQSHDKVSDPRASKSYMINVASNQNGVGYGSWVHIDGFSENVIRFIHEYEDI